MKTEKYITDKNISFDINELMGEIESIEAANSIDTLDFDDLDLEPWFIANFIKSHFVEEIYTALEKKSLSKAAFAKKLNKSRQYVTHVLNETANFTIDSMAQISCALEMELTIELSELVRNKVPQNIYTFQLPTKNFCDTRFVSVKVHQLRDKIENGIDETGCIAAS